MYYLTVIEMAKKLSNKIIQVNGALAERVTPHSLYEYDTREITE